MIGPLGDLSAASLSMETSGPSTKTLGPLRWLSSERIERQRFIPTATAVLGAMNDRLGSETAAKSCRQTARTVVTDS